MEKLNHERLKYTYAGGIAVLLALGMISWNLGSDESHQLGEQTKTPSSEQHESYFEHNNITATVFWVGEGESADNKFIHNRSSAWVEDWVAAYGGVDAPDSRCDYRPCGFVPKENPFYFALPYNDLDDKGRRKESAEKVPWHDEGAPEYKSLLKNRWIAVEKDGKVAYGQWEDVGPFGEDDFDYVFGTKRPKAPEAGIDLSPAMADYLDVNGRSLVTWEFVDEAEVPEGPWRDILTSSQ